MSAREGNPREHPAIRPNEHSATDEYSRTAAARESEMSVFLGRVGEAILARQGSELSEELLGAFVRQVEGLLRLVVRRTEGNALTVAGASPSPASTMPRGRIPVTAGKEHPVAEALLDCKQVSVPAGSYSDLFPGDLETWLQGRGFTVLPIEGTRGPVGVAILQSEGGQLAREQIQQASRLLPAIAAVMETTGGGGLPSFDLLERLAAAAVGIERAGSMPEVYHHLARACGRIAEPGLAVVWSYDERSSSLSVAARYAASPAFDAEELLPVLEQVARIALEHGAGVGPASLEEITGEEVGFAGLRALGLPMRHLDEMLGVVVVVLDAPEPRALEVAERACRVLASMGALAAENARFNERAGEMRKHIASLEDELVRRERLAAVGELSAKLAHEIKSPLSAIGGFARRIERSLPDEDPSREHARIIVREATRLEGMLEEHLSLASEPKRRIAMVDINQVVRDSVRLLKDDLLSRGLFLEETYSDGLPQLLLDADRMRQVIINMLRNAIDWTRDGDTVRIETFKQGDHVLIEIANTGEKPSGEILEDLFTPFATGKPGGTGLGLAVARQIIHEHQGEIGVRSEGDWGAIFTISLPISVNRDRRKRQRRSGKDRRGK